MSDTPITLQILQFLQTQFEQIRTTNGYLTDIGANVYLERHQFQPGDPDFIVITMPKTQRTGGQGISPLQRTATIQIEAVLPDVASADPDGVVSKYQTAHLVVADLEKAFSQRTDQFSSQVKMIFSTDTAIEDSPDGLNAVVVTMTASANYKPVAA